MSNKSLEHDKLFDEWILALPEHRGKFIKDGIINEEVFDKQKTKILFITKEPNKPEQEEGDFRIWWKDEIPAYKFSYRIAEWSYGILNDFPEFDSIYKWGYPTKYVSALQSIAFMNLKKTGGNGSADNNDVEDHLRRNKDFLLRQIEIIKPDIIILGLSRLQYLRDGLFDNLSWKDTGHDVQIARWKESKLINFHHPSSYSAPSAAYSLLQNVIHSQSFQNL